MNDHITRAAWDAATGRIPVPTKPFYCLSLARRIIEHAIFNDEYRFYDTYLTTGSSMRIGKHAGKQRQDPWASDLEASMKHLRYTIPVDERQAGDLIFNHKAAQPYGHVGILIDQNTVLENIRNEYRPHSIHLGRYLSLTPLEHFKHTLIARLQPR